MHYNLLTISDLLSLQQIGRLTYEPYYQHVWHPGGMEWYIDHCFNTERLTEELNDPQCEYYIATTDVGAWVGLLKLILNKPLPTDSTPDPLYLAGKMKDDYAKNAGQATAQEQMVDKKVQNLPLSLEKIYLMPDFYKKGMGQVLVQFVLERARQLGCPAVWLNVMKTGPVQSYEKAGFRIVGEQRIPFELIKDAEREMWVMVYNTMEDID